MRRGKKIIYLHHKSYHPAHGEYARFIDATFLKTNKYFELSYGGFVNMILRYLDWLLLLITFPYRKCTAILTDEAHYLAVIIKLISFNRIQLMATQDAQTVSDIYDQEYSPFTARLLSLAYNKYDLIICIGSFQHELVQKLVSNPNTKIAVSFNGVDLKRSETLKEINLNVDSKNIVAISNITSQRMFEWKGLEKTLEIFTLLKKKFKDINYIHIGPFIQDIIDDVKLRRPEFQWDSIFFLGKKRNIEDYLNDALLFVHFSKKEAWGIAVSESCYSGIPTFISSNVGAKQMYLTIEDHDKYICDFDNLINQAEEKITDYLSLSKENKLAVSKEFKTKTSFYTAMNANLRFKQIVDNFLNEKK